MQKRFLPLLFLTGLACCGHAKSVPPPVGDGGGEVEASRRSVAQPTITPNGGSFSGPVDVTLADATAGASVRYTLDGSTPTSSSTLYTAPFKLSATAKLSARGFKDGLNPSGTVSATFTIAAPTPPPSPTPSAGAWVAGYYAGYQKDLYPISAIDWADLTHVILAAALPNADGTLNTAFYIDSVNGPAFAKQLTAAAHQNGKFALMMVGGAGANGWGQAMATANFIPNLLIAMTDLGFDGLDLDYEPSTFDMPAFAKFVQALRAAAPNIVLSAPAGWINPNWQTVDPNWVTIAGSVDRVNAMTYGMAGAWSGWLSWHSSALTGSAGQTPSAVDVTAKAYLAAGIPASKLGVGAGFYGSCWQGTVTGPGQPLGVSAIVADDNTMSFTNIMASYYSQAAYHYDSAAQAPYLSFAAQTGPAKCNWVSYEDPTSLQAKGAWVKGQGLGGVIVWTINQGYLPTAPAGSQNPALQALYKGVMGL